MSAYSLPKVLVACPTAAVKNYCFDRWLDNVFNFTYPQFDIRLFDNTPDGGRNAMQLNKKYAARYFKVPTISFLANNPNPPDDKFNTGVIERMERSHNECRVYALKNDYDYLLHLESDVFPPNDVIESLLAHQKKVVGALYYIDEGAGRKPMIQLHAQVGENFSSSYQVKGGENECAYLAGELLKVASCGLGCTLINVKVFDKIRFRWEKGVNKHPDTFFMQDCERHKIDVFCDTSILCEHENKAWGLFGIDFK